MTSLLTMVDDVATPSQNDEMLSNRTFGGKMFDNTSVFSLVLLVSG